MVWESSGFTSTVLFSLFGQGEEVSRCFALAGNWVRYWIRGRAKSCADDSYTALLISIDCALYLVAGMDGMAVELSCKCMPRERGGPVTPVGTEE